MHVVAPTPPPKHSTSSQPTTQLCIWGPVSADRIDDNFCAWWMEIWRSAGSYAAPRYVAHVTNRPWLLGLHLISSHYGCREVKQRPHTDLHTHTHGTCMCHLTRHMSGIMFSALPKIKSVKVDELSARINFRTNRSNTLEHTQPEEKKKNDSPAATRSPWRTKARGTRTLPPVSPPPWSPAGSPCHPKNKKEKKWS